MEQTYFYRDLTSLVQDDEDVYFTVEFVSDGNTGQTKINIPGTNDPWIEDAGTKLLGKGINLRSAPTISFSSIFNPLPVGQEDEIRIRYKINDQLIKEHENSKEEVDTAYIILEIKFPAP